MSACVGVCAREREKERNTETKNKEGAKRVRGNKWTEEDGGIEVGPNKGLDSSVMHHVQILPLFPLTH